MARSQPTSRRTWKEPDIPIARPVSAHPFYSDVGTRPLYQSTGDCLHVVPSYCSSVEPPYLKIINAPVTYLH